MAYRATGMAELEEAARGEGQMVARSRLQRTLLLWVQSVSWPSSVVDPEGGLPYRRNRWAPLSINTAVGPVVIHSPSYEKVGKPSLRPAEAILGIRKTISPLLQKLCAHVAAELPFAAAENELRDLAQVQVSRNTINRVSLEMGDSAEADQRDLHMPEGFGEATRVTVQIDGGRVNTNEGWKEPRLARIQATNADGRIAVFLLTAIVSAETFWPRIVNAIKQLGLATCSRLAFLSDGAKWILPEAARLFPLAVCILDFYHAAEHIHDAAKLIFGEGSAQARSWARRYVKRLRRGQILAVLEAWRRAASTLATRGAVGAKAIDGLIEYFQGRVENVRYRTFRRRGFPIGSGQIEAAVKQVLNLRLKRNGAWWNTRNAERILALRAAKILGRLEAVWERKIMSRVAEVPAQFAHLVVSSPPPAGLAA